MVPPFFLFSFVILNSSYHIKLTLTLPVLRTWNALKLDSQARFSETSVCLIILGVIPFIHKKFLGKRTDIYSVTFSQSSIFVRTQDRSKFSGLNLIILKQSLDTHLELIYFSF